MTTHGLPSPATTPEDVHEGTPRTVGCPQCGLPAEIIDQAVVPSTAGPVDIIHVVCVQRHWFLMPLERLTTI
jgi:hypothetical protein